MNEKEIKKVKEKYIDLCNKQKRILELQQNKLVKEYVELTNTYGNLVNENIVYKAFSEVAVNTTENNNIYVYNKSYRYYAGEGVEIIDEKRPDYIRYENLETGKFLDIKSNNKENFEKNNIVIYLDQTVYSNEFCFDKEYAINVNQLRNKFFELLFIKPIDEAIEELLKQERQLVKKK